MAPIFLKINPNLVPKFPIPSQSRSHKLLTVLLHSFNIYGISPNHHRRQLPSPPSTCLVISVGISPSPVRTLLFRCCHSQSLCRRCRTTVPVQVKQVADLAGKSEIHQFFSFSGEFEYRVRENKLEGSFLCWLKKSASNSSFSCLLREVEFILCSHICEINAHNRSFFFLLKYSMWLEQRKN